MKELFSYCYERTYKIIKDMIKIVLTQEIINLPKKRLGMRLFIACCSGYDFLVPCAVYIYLVLPL